MKPLLDALGAKPPASPPLWLMRQAGRYLPEYRALRCQAPDFLSFCYNPELAVEATLQPLRRFDLDAAILFSDILVVPHALGQEVTFVEGEGPRLEPIRHSEELGRLKPDRVLAHLAPVFESVRRLRGLLPERKSLIGFAGAPWTIAVYMVEGRGGTDGAAVRAWALSAPETFQRLIDILTEATAAYLIEQARQGAEAVQLFDSWAGMLTESGFRRWVIAPTRSIVERLHAARPELPVIGFPRGAGVLCRAYAAETGVDGISIDSTVPAGWAAEVLQPLCAVQGNLDNHVLLAGGAVLDRETTAVLDRLGNGRHVFNLGHGVLPATPPEHVARVVELVRAWRRP